ncbi:MAG: host attachment protein [Gammaproteobacteria bacterium]|nr:host attachment protein [Gammaproteobacteria bacterium]
MTTWVIVADSSRGKIYVQKKHNGELQEAVDLVHPGARLRGVDLSSDRAGGHVGAFGQGSHVFDARTAAKEHEAESFAKEIAERLESGRNSGQFQRLVLIAPPEFLGLLREQLGDNLRRLVVEEIAKDLVTHSADEVRDKLQQVT